MQEKWIIKDLVEWTTRYFLDKNIKNSRLEAEILLARVLEKDRVYLYANYEKPVNKNERELYKEYIQRRVRGEPAAYITGYKEFMSLLFAVKPAVLIPRPETEILVEKAIDLIKIHGFHRICDIGTGSGAIAVAIAYYIKDIQVYATDISEPAIEIARDNAAKNRVEIQFFCGDLMFPLAEEPPFDVILANLPYITGEEYIFLDNTVKNYEPVLALQAPGDGLDIYRRLLMQARDKLRPGGYILMEIGHKQGESALKMMRDFFEVELIKDYSGHDRLIKGRKESWLENTVYTG